MKGIVFLDFDNTIIHGDAGPLLAMRLFKRRKARIEQAPHGPSRAARKTLLWGTTIPYVSWMMLRAGLYKARAVRRSSIVRSAYKGFRGVPVHAFEAVLEEFVDDEIVPAIYPDIVADMEAHRKAGRSCVIITTGMELLVKEVLPHLPKGTQLIGCQLEQKEGRLTGNVTTGPLYGQDKANIVAAFCQERGVDPADCWAYSDHYSDYQMLQAVGHAVCVNPARRLRQLAATSGWRVMDLKDPRAQ